MADVNFFLPKLSFDKKITPPSKAGLWKSDARTVIKGISDAIDIGENAQGVSSIPDIWARPLMFQNFLFSVYKKRNPNSDQKQELTLIEKRAFGEWKGLLSILALKKTKLKDEKIEVVPFSPKENDRFCRALTTLAPRPIFIEKNKGYAWTDIMIIRFKGVPVGAFSPSTLVYTAVDYNNDFKKKFNSGSGSGAGPSIMLDSDGFLCPPTKEKDLLAVGEWVNNLKTQLSYLLNTSDQARETDRSLATMNGVLLDIWLTEIREMLNISEEETINSEEVRPSLDTPYFDESKPPEFLKEYKIYEALLHPLEIDDSFIELSKSDIELKFERNYLKYKDKEVKHILIISDKLYSDDYRIWDQLRFDRLGNNIDNILNTYFNKASDQVIKGKDIPLATDGILWVRPELFFLTDTLVSSKNELNLLAGSESDLNINLKFVLPFKKEILDFFSPAEIKTILNPAYDDRPDRVIFTFNLPIIGKKEPLQVKKIFKKKSSEKGEGTIVEIETPIIDIFPDYIGDNWRKYYLFQGNIDKLKVNPVIFGDNVQETHKDYVKNYSGSNQKVRVTSISGDNSFPEGLALFDENDAPAGLILINKKERSRILEDQWTIGIDFGTSNTNVYKKVGEDGIPQHWSYDFEGYTRNISNNTSDLKGKLFNDFFVPTSRIDLPITTTLKLYNRDNDENKDILTDFFIYFPQDKKYEFPDFVLSNIKWDGEIINTKFFLKNLLFLILVEVVQKNAASVVFAYSWPKAFSQETMVLFQQTWDAVYEELVLKDRRVVNAKSPESTGNKISIERPTLNASEGVASGEFFASKLNSTSSSRLRIASVCMDVGGGTTDISIWWNNKIVEDFSVRFAGMQISALLQKSGILRKLLFSPEACIALEVKDNSEIKKSLTKFAAVLNHVLKIEEHEINSRLINLANDEKVRRFRQMIAIEFGALAYYAGMVCFSVGKRNVKANRSLLSDITSGGISLYWGGNASKLLNWLDLGKYKEDGLASFLLNSLFYNCLSDKSLGSEAVAMDASKLRQVQSPSHKSEASGGLVAMKWQHINTEPEVNDSRNNDMVVDTDDTGNATDINQILKSQVICGENIEIEGKKIAFHEVISDKTFFYGSQTTFTAESIGGMERLSKFITIINIVGIRKGFFTEDTKIILSESERQAIRNTIASEFLENQSYKASKRIIEPIFIMEIRALMDILWNKWIK
ncbi:MAG: hypothetical protein ABI863_01895 [Ginsengibacter sp.]